MWRLVRALQADRPPDREIVHSHDFNRYLTPFRAEWDPKDPFERVVVVGRYVTGRAVCFTSLHCQVRAHNGFRRQEADMTVAQLLLPLNAV